MGPLVLPSAPARHVRLLSFGRNIAGDAVSPVELPPWSNPGLPLVWQGSLAFRYWSKEVSCAHYLQSVTRRIERMVWFVKGGGSWHNACYQEPLSYLQVCSYLAVACLDFQHAGCFCMHRNDPCFGYEHMAINTTTATNVKRRKTDPKN